MAPSTSAWRGRAAAPVRMVHLGLGNFFLAHQAWYTEHARDAEDWGYAAFTGRSHRLADALRAQDGAYTLVTKTVDGDEFELVNALSAVHPGDDQAALGDYFRRTELAVATLTITEAGYCANRDGGLDLDRPEIAADLATLRASTLGTSTLGTSTLGTSTLRASVPRASTPRTSTLGTSTLGTSTLGTSTPHTRALGSGLTAPVRTAPAKLVAALAARRQADAGPLAIVPCDNLLANGSLTSRIIGELAALIDDGLATWIRDSVTVVTTMVDRITPPATSADELAVLRHTGRPDRCPVTTEPFTEWALSGPFPSGRPRWQDAGAIFTADIHPFEKRKLWMLNASHSLVAYAGSIIGHVTVADAVADEVCQGWLDEWWTIAAAHLDQSDEELTKYRAALRHRFENAAMGDRLDRIAADGSQKLPVRVLPVLRAERQAGRLPAAATRTLAAWLCHLRGYGAAVNDARADEVVPLAQGRIAEAAPRVLGWLDPELAADHDVVGAVIDQSQAFCQKR